MKKLLYLISCVLLICVSCNKEGIIHDGYNGFINLDGKRVLDLMVAYNDDITEFGLGKLNWCFFTEEQDVHLINPDQLAAVISLSDSGKIVELELNVPSYGELYVDGRHDYHNGDFEETADNSYKVTDAIFIERLEGNNYTRSIIEGTLVFNKLVYNDKGSILQMDMTLKMNSEIRIVFDGKTPVVYNLRDMM